MLEYLWSLLIGGVAGISMGTIGIGAGLITIPLLVYNNMTLNQAVATAMVMQLLPQSAPGVYNYWKDILWIPSLLVVLGSILGIWFGSYIVRQKIVSNRFLYRTITIFLFVSSVYFFITHWNHTDLDIIE